MVSRHEGATARASADCSVVTDIDHFCGGSIRATERSVRTRKVARFTRSNAVRSSLFHHVFAASGSPQANPSGKKMGDD